MTHKEAAKELAKEIEKLFPKAEVCVDSSCFDSSHIDVSLPEYSQIGEWVFTIEIGLDYGEVLYGLALIEDGSTCEGVECVLASPATLIKYLGRLFPKAVKEHSG